MTKKTTAETPENRDKEVSSAERLKEIIEVFGRYNLIRGLTPEKLRHILEELGPTFIKLGQLMSMRPDMLPAEYCLELSKLRSGVTPLNFEEIRSILEREYGKDYTEVFSSIDEEPIGSASIAQVHCAVLRDGRRVVLKIQRPNIYERMDRDIKLLRKAAYVAKIAVKTGSVIDFGGILDEIWAVAKQELDFLTEAEHIRRFSELNNLSFALFPHVERELTTPRVLCMEKIEGIRIDDTELLRKAGCDLSELARELASAYVKQVLDDGFFHADPHPGNIIVRDGRIVWLDLGMTGSLSPRDRVLFKNAIVAVAAGDVYGLKAAVLGISRHSGKINHSRLTDDLDSILSNYGSLEIGSINIGEVMTDLISVARSNGLSMPAGIAMLSRGVITLESVIAKLDPETNVVSLFSDVMSTSLVEEFDIFNELEKAKRLLLGLGGKAADLSSNLSEVMRLASRGQSRLNIEIIGSEEPLEKVGGMVNRLIVAIINAAILIGSSLICLTDMSPKLLGIPFLGVVVYSASLILGAWLLYKTIFSKKR